MEKKRSEVFEQHASDTEDKSARHRRGLRSEGEPLGVGRRVFGEFEHFSFQVEWLLQRARNVFCSAARNALPPPRNCRTAFTSNTTTNQY